MFVRRWDQMFADEFQDADTRLLFCICADLRKSVDKLTSAARRIQRYGRIQFWVLIVAMAPAVAIGAPPNIVVFLVDDLGARDVGCFGSTFYETPRIDRLAREGMRFTAAYASCPVCSPTRASMMTGKYPQRTGITDYINTRGTNQPEKWPRNTKLLPAPTRIT